MPPPGVTQSAPPCFDSRGHWLKNSRGGEYTYPIHRLGGGAPTPNSLSATQGSVAPRPSHQPHKEPRLQAVTADHGGRGGTAYTVGPWRRYPPDGDRTQ